MTINIGHSQYRNYAGQPYAQPYLLIWKTDTIHIQTFPLSYWSKFDQKVLFGNNKVKPSCWGCLKNYTAEWKIIDNKLYLSNIYSFNFKQDNIKANLNKLFPDKIKNKLVFVNWYSGNLFVPKGGHIWMGKSPGFPIHESEWKLIISNGKIVKKEFNSGNYHKSIYSQNSKNLVTFMNKHLDEKVKSKLKNKKISIIFKTGKSKKSYSVSIKGLNEKSTKDKLIETLKTLPDFDYYYRNGEELNLIIRITYFDNRIQKLKASE